MNKKGFISTSVIFAFFIAFLMLLMIIVTSYAQNRILMNQVKKDIKSNLVGKYKFVPSGIPLYSVVKKGDYIKMTPTLDSYQITSTQTGYNSTQTINPKELNLWRVIRINSDNTVDMVSEYVSSVKVYFSSQTGYQNFIGTLNYIAKQYENQKYTSGSRYMGYSNQTEYITDTSVLIATTAPQTSSTSSSNVTETTEAQGLGDMGYETDFNLVNKALGTSVAYKAGTTTSAAYWLASREYVYSSSNKWHFKGRYINTSGSLTSYNLHIYNFGSLSAYWTSYAVRPIVTLKSDISNISGNGTSESPYILP